MENTSLYGKLYNLSGDFNAVTDELLAIIKSETDADRRNALCKVFNKLLDASYEFDVLTDDDRLYHRLSHC